MQLTITLRTSKTGVFSRHGSNLNSVHDSLILSTKAIITIDLVNYVTISNSLSLGMIYDQRTGENSDFKEHFKPNLDRIR